MKTISVRLFSVTTLALLGSLPLQGSAQPPTPSVRISGPLPLPVTLDQASPSTVKNSDEPGREPYQVYIEFSRAGCGGFNCSNFASLGDVVLFDGPLVPSDKRLILQSITGRLPNTGITNVSVLLQESQVLSQQLVKWGFYGPFFSQFSLVGFSSPLFATYEPGDRPHFNLIMPAGNNFVGYVSVSGYLIDADN